MTGPTKISRGDAAKALALLQPRLIASRLLEDEGFRAEFGIPSDPGVSYAGGPMVRKSELYQAVRRAFADSEPIELAGIDGGSMTVVVGDDKIAVSFAVPDGSPTLIHPPSLMLLCPETEGRQKALRRALDELGPTGPDPAFWEKEVERGPLDDAAINRFSDEVAASFVPHMGRIAQDVATGILDKTHLVPHSLEYWERLCGAVLVVAEQETWLKEVSLPHRQNLIARDLTRGLDLCVAMNIGEDLSPRSLVENIPDDELWDALGRLWPVNDPFSLLGILDIAAARAEHDARFASLETEIVERLCAEKLTRHDGRDVYGFMPAFVDLIESDFREIPQLATRPAFWRRICAWTQAAMLVRAFHYVTFDTETFSKDIERFQSGGARTAELLDLRQSSLSYPGDNGRVAVRAEILGRLLILQQREKRRGRDLGGSQTLMTALEQLAELAPMLAHLPGPMERHRLPMLTLDQCSDEFRANWQDRTAELTDNLHDANWIRFIYLSRLIRYDASLTTRMTDLIRMVNLGSANDERRASFVRLAQLSYAAAAQRNVAFADSILARSLQSVGIWTDEDDAGALFRIGLIATAAYGQAAAVEDRFARYLRNLSSLLPRGAPCRTLGAELEVLKRFLPVGEWFRFAQADSLSLLGS